MGKSFTTINNLFLLDERCRSQIHAKNAFFGRTQLEYHGYWITKNGIQILPKKVQAKLSIKSPTTRKQLRSFIGMVNYYRDIWVRSQKS